MLNMSSAGQKRPCETGLCDSTTGGVQSYDFPTAQLGGNSSVNFSGSHYPIEHLDPAVKTEPMSMAYQAKTMNDDFESSIPEKGPDSTFVPCPASISVSLSPPPYNVGLPPNNIQNFSTATLHSPSPQQSALDQLGQVMNEPVTILGYRTLHELGLRLDPEMLPSQNWKMMAEYMNFNNWQIKKFENEKSPTMAAISAWGRMGMHTVGELLQIINHQMNRPDVITDIPEFILNDYRRHESNRQKQQSFESVMPCPVPPFPLCPSPGPGPMNPYGTGIYHPYQSQFSVPLGMGSIPQPSQFSSIVTELESYAEKPTAGNSSLPVQVRDIQPSQPAFDAFVLCNMADKEFVVHRFIPKVETEAHLKLCFAERDITPGQFAFTDAMNYMFKRSRKLVVILSDEFFSSKEHEWQSNLAISQDPASRSQTIIPVKYKKLSNRNIFDYLGCCDLTKTMKEEWFWDKIINGIKA